MKYRPHMTFSSLSGIGFEGTLEGEKEPHGL